MENVNDPVYDLRFSINYYGADYPVDTLVYRMEREEFIIPNFQRTYVWRADEASKFIESLLLGLPVPSIFLAKDKFSSRLIVIDGQQRLRTLQYFYRGQYPDGKPFKLRNISSPFLGLSYNELSPQDRRNLDNAVIHCIIIAEDEDSNRIFYLFERLNTTGTPLNSQEIRNALYHGPFNEMLFRLGESELWLRLYHKQDNRLEYLELILRFFALHYELESYTGNMNQFLNDFMLNNRSFQNASEEEFLAVFHDTMNIILDYLGGNAFYKRGVFNRSLFEVVAVTVSKHLHDDISEKRISRFYELLTERDDNLNVIKSSAVSRSGLLAKFHFANDIFSESLV